MKKSIKNIAHRLPPSEMKKIKGGLAALQKICRSVQCHFYDPELGTLVGFCQSNAEGDCTCNGDSNLGSGECPFYYYMPLELGIDYGLMGFGGFK